MTARSININLQRVLKKASERRFVVITMDYKEYYKKLQNDGEKYIFGGGLLFNLCIQIQINILVHS